MKKKISLILVLSVLSVLCLPVNKTFAATELGDNGETIILEDGTVIHYDNTVMNGGINLSESRNTSINKTITNRSVAESVELPITFETQKYYYYCAPAAAKMLLSSIGFNVTQDYLATLFKTSPEEGTAAGSHLANAMNNIVSGSRYGFTWKWYDYSASSVSTVKSNFVEALSYGNPVMANTVEYAGDWYLNGHDNYLPLYHFGLVADYFNYGNEVTYVDPGYGMFTGFSMNQRVSITNMCKAMGTRGYVW